ncbi:hypothetical protein LTR27_011235 [Elasticomyces elasticus]|nr:hypothetical protein LTR27_011235 [Elasticomyces elasticus]
MLPSIVERTNERTNELANNNTAKHNTTRPSSRSTATTGQHSSTPTPSQPNNSKPKMHLVILGASGRTGQLTTTTALAKNYTVTALVRNPASLPPTPGLTISQGTPLNPSDIEAAFTSSPHPVDACIVTLSAPRETDSPFSKPVAPPMLMRDSVRTSLAVMKQHGVRRLVVMSAFGVGDSFASLAWPLRQLFRRSNMSYGFEDHDALDLEVRKESAEGGWGLEWTLVRPVMLKEGPVKAVRKLGERGEKAGMFDSVTRESVASFLVEVIEGGRLKGEAVVVAN